MATDVADGMTAGAGTGRAHRRGGRDPRASSRGSRLLGTHWYAWAMCAPVVVVTLVLVGYPLARGIYLSLTDATEANLGRTIGMNHIPSTYEFVGVQNYLDILGSGVFLSRLAWTITWTVVCVALHYGIGLGLAMLLHRPMRLRSFYRVLLVLPWAVPAFVSAFIWRYLFNGEFGVINAMLRAAGMGGISWLDDPFWAKLSVIAVNVWLGVPFMMLALLGGLSAIPRELHEAAEVDGATPLQRFRHITLPGLRPVSSTVILLGTIWTFNQFPVIFLLTKGGPGGSTEILVTYAYRQAFEGIRDYSGSAAWGMVILALLVALAVVYRRALRGQGEVW